MTDPQDEVVETVAGAAIDALELRREWRAWGRDRTWPTAEQALADRCLREENWHSHRIFSRLVGPWR